MWGDAAKGADRAEVGRRRRREGFREIPGATFQRLLPLLPAEDAFDSAAPRNRCALVGSDRSLAGRCGMLTDNFPY